MNVQPNDTARLRNVAKAAFALGAVAVIAGHPITVDLAQPTVTVPEFATMYSGLDFAGFAVLAIGAAALAMAFEGRSRMAATTAAILLGLAASVPVLWGLVIVPSDFSLVLSNDDQLVISAIALGYLLAGVAMVGLAVTATLTVTRALLVASAVAALLQIVILQRWDAPIVTAELAQFVFAVGPLALALTLGAAPTHKATMTT